MYRLPYSLLLVLAVLIGGCKPESKPTVFESKHDEHEQHSHDRGKMMLADFGAYHAGLTAHLSSKEGNELDIVVETDEKEPKPVPVPQSKLHATASRNGEDKTYTLEFDPAPKDERKEDPEGKCSRFTAKAPWIKHADILTITATIPLNGQEKKVVWVDFNPKKYAHVDE
jgi:hypothetical protein